MPDRKPEPIIEALFREEWGRLVATAIRMLGDMDRAEEIVQQALVAAMEHWPKSGQPDRPGAWLMTTVRNRCIDELRSRQRNRAKHAEIAALASSQEWVVQSHTDVANIPDDRLRLIFICCHPLLSADSRVALTLRLLGGLSTAEIARAFLVGEATIAQRIVRAKRTIGERELEYRVPEPAEIPERLPTVLEVVYLIFNEGYAAREGDALVRRSLCDDAIRLAALLAELLPGQPEVLGLLALLEFQASRNATRVDPMGEIVLLQEQDRALWDRVQIERATRHVASALEAGPLGSYAIQALIAQEHARAPNWEATDWTRIIQCYDALIRLTDSPVVKLNRAVAVAMHSGPQSGLALVDELAREPKLARYPWLPATRADLLRRLGRLSEAAVDYQRAIDRTANDREIAYLRRRLEECLSR